jgi:hypothetical protein
MKVAVQVVVRSTCVGQVKWLIQSGVALRLPPHSMNLQQKLTGLPGGGFSALNFPDPVSDYLE